MAEIPDKGITDIITVPYSGEVKDGLLIIVKVGGQISSAMGLALYRENGHHLSSRFISGAYDIRVTIQSYSNGVFTLNLLSGGFESYEVAFLQLNLN